jgi:hypothetical protein
LKAALSLAVPSKSALTAASTFVTCNPSPAVRWITNPMSAAGPLMMAFLSAISSSLQRWIVDQQQ